jgi:hypothetical protein
MRFLKQIDSWKFRSDYDLSGSYEVQWDQTRKIRTTPYPSDHSKFHLEGISSADLQLNSSVYRLREWVIKFTENHI